MVALIAYRLVAWIRDRRAMAALREAGWTPIADDDPALRDAIDDLRLSSSRARFFDRARLGEGTEALLFVARQIRRGGGTDPSLGGGSTITLAIAPRAAREPIGVVTRREGGLAESALLGLAGALGSTPIEPPGWEWAIVSGPGAVEAWPAGAGAALEQALRPGERLYLGERHVAIAAAPHRPRSELMGAARDRLAAIRAALSG